MALPPLREDLQLLKGHDNLFGGSTWMIFDPVGHRFFQIDYQTFEILTHWSIGDRAGLAEKIERQRGCKPENAVIDAVINFLKTHQLVGNPEAGSWRYLLAREKRAKSTVVQWLKYKYLFFRLPLFRPEKLLKAIAFLAEPVYCRAFWYFVLMIFCLNLYLLNRLWNEFTSTIYRFATIDSIYYYALVVIFVKIFHELGHALTARRYGCRVPTMGIAFMVFYPVFYTDVTDAWRLTNKFDRIRIGLAGVLVELVIAVFATLLWVFTPDGITRNLLFFLATSSWVISITINLNPFMRFDGYYVLSDWLGVPNLGSRSFAFGKWRLRRFLFGVDTPPPEPLPRKIQRSLIIYAYCTWVYRCFLFVAIALVIYALLPKVLGLPLACVEIVFLVLMPIFLECREWWKMRKEILANSRTWLTISVSAVLVGLFFYPLQSSVVAPAVLDSFDRFEIFANQPAKLTKVHVQQGQHVEQGDLLFEFDNPILGWEKQQSSTRLELVGLQLDRRTADQRDLARSIVLEQQRLVEIEALAGIAKLEHELTIRAPYDGVIIELGPELHAGRWMATGATLAAIGREEGSRITGSLDGPDLARIVPNGEAYFLARDPAFDRIPVTLTHIDEVAGRTLSEPYLSSAYGGGVPVEVDATGAHKTARTHFTLNFQLMEPISIDRILRGSIHLEAKPESYFQIFLRQVLRVAIWESRV